MDIDSSIFNFFQILDIQKYTPLLDLCYVHMECATISNSLIFNMYLYLAS
jgi:hypothetical protein